MYIIIRSQEEKWKELIYKNIKPIYLISNYGRVKNKITNKLLSICISEKGYEMVGLMTSNKKTNKCIKLHRNVAYNFLKLPDFNDGQTWTVNHKDGDKKNNYFENLEWVTFTDNIIHSFKEGLNQPLRGEENGHNKYPEELIHMICSLFQEEKSNRQIRKELYSKYGYLSKYLLYDLRHKKSWEHITRLYSY